MELDFDQIQAKRPSCKDSVMPWVQERVSARTALWSLQHACVHVLATVAELAACGSSARSLHLQGRVQKSLVERRATTVLTTIRPTAQTVRACINSIMNYGEVPIMPKPVLQHLASLGANGTLAAPPAHCRSFL